MANISTKIDLNITEFLTNLKKSSDASKAAAEEMKKQFTKALEGTGIKLNTAEINKAIAEFDKLKNKAQQAGKEVGEKLGENIQKGVKKGFLGLDTKALTSSMLGVFSGSLLASGMQGLLAGFGDIIKAGKALDDQMDNLELGFKQAGLSGGGLQNQMEQSAEFTKSLSDNLAISEETVRKYTASAALMGGATGQTNEDIVQLAVGVEKATNGMINGDMIIRSFTRGLGDPEAEANLGRLKMAFPQLATALKDVQNPAEMTKKALSALSPTFDSLKEQSTGSIESIDKFGFAMDELKATIGKASIDLFAPIIEGIGTYVVPAVQAVISSVGSVMGFIGENKTVLLAAGLAWGTFSAAVWLANGGLTRAYAGMILYAKDVIAKYVPSILTKTVVTEAEALATGQAAGATYVWNAALKASPIMWWVAGIGAAVAAIAIFTDWFGKSAESKLKDAEAEGKLIERQIKSNEAKQNQIKGNLELMNSYESLASKKNRTAEEDVKLNEAQMQLNRTIPGSIKSTTDYAANLVSVKEEAKKSALELANMKEQMTKLQIEAAKNANQKAALKVNVEAEKTEDNDIMNILGIGGDSSAQEMVDNYVNAVKNASSQADVDGIAQTFSVKFNSKYAALLKDNPEAALALQNQFDNIAKAGGDVAETAGKTLRDRMAQEFEKGNIIDPKKLQGEIGTSIKDVNTQVVKTGLELIDKGKKADEVYASLAKTLKITPVAVKSLVDEQRRSTEEAKKQAAATEDIGTAWTNAQNIQKESLNKILPEYAALMDEIKRGNGTQDDERRLAMLREQAGHLQGEIKSRDDINKAAKILSGLSENEVITTKKQLAETLKIYDLELERLRVKIYQGGIFSEESKEAMKQFSELWNRRHKIETEGVKESTKTQKEGVKSTFDEQLKRIKEYGEEVNKITKETANSQAAFNNEANIDTLKKNRESIIENLDMNKENAEVVLSLFISGNASKLQALKKNLDDQENLVIESIEREKQLRLNAIPDLIKAERETKEAEAEKEYRGLLEDLDKQKEAKSLSDKQYDSLRLDLFGKYRVKLSNIENEFTEKQRQDTLKVENEINNEKLSSHKTFLDKFYDQAKEINEKAKEDAKKHEEEVLAIREAAIERWKTAFESTQNIITKLFTNETKEEVDARKKATKEKTEEYNKEREALQKLVNANEIDYNEYMRRLSDLDDKRKEDKKKDDEEEKKRIEAKNKEIWKDVQDTYKNMTKDIVKFTKENGVQWQSLGEIAVQASMVMGTALAAAIKTGDVKGFLKTLALSIIDFAQSAVNAYAAAAIAKDALTFFTTSPLTAAAILGANVLLGLARAAISGWKEGGFTGFGDPNKPAGIVHMGEFVIPQKAMVANPDLKDFLEGIRKGNSLSTMAVDYTGKLTMPDMGSFRKPTMDSAGSSTDVLYRIENRLISLEKTTENTGKKFHSKQGIEIEMTPLELKGSDFQSSLSRTSKKALRRR